MPFRIDPKTGHYHQVPNGDPRGTHKLPPAPNWGNVPGLKITWKTPVKPAIKPKDKPNGK
jgi:hypothetical protein